MRESNHSTIEFPASSRDVLTELLRRDRWPGYRAAGASTNRSTAPDARLCRECMAVSPHSLSGQAESPTSISVAVSVVFPPAAVTFMFCRISFGERFGAMLAARAEESRGDH